ncbi:uncharacterized protein [Halyomorpha halys]|uniref:uncharacterized protein isoform X2 n=1 Tax=Halyomorpha halys TaxID=286706 RepID=UPI0006D4E380|nr:uncharacterized protein LOC106681669 isoform X2 [Halyomorpha halys]
MHSNISECDTELEIPSKKIKLSPVPEHSKTKEKILSKVLQKEIQQEINLRKDDLELIERNIFLVRQKLTQLKQVLSSEYYRQKSVKGCLQYPPHPAVKDTFIGKCPAGSENYSSITSTSNEEKSVESHAIVKKEFEPAQGVSNDDGVIAPSAEIKKLLEHDKLPCYIPPNVTDDNVVKPTEPRGIDSKIEIRIIVGNVSKWLAPLESSDATHKWTVYAKLAQNDLDISLFVKKVVFFLHKSYRPNDIIEIKYPPFKLTRRGWGEFPLKAQFHFKSPDNPPIDLMHHLKLDHIHTGFETFGAETSLTVWVHPPAGNGIPKGTSKPTEEISIKTENVTNINEYQIVNKPNSNEQNIFGNSDAISDISLNATIDSFEKDISAGAFSFPEHSCDSESISSLFDEIKHEGLQSFSSLLTSFQGNEVQVHQNFIKENYSEEAELYSGKNKIIENQVKNEEIFFSNQNFPELNSDGTEIVEVKQPKIEENFSEINFNEFEREGLFVDECAVVAEEIVIDCDDCDSGIAENKKTSLHEPIDTKDNQQTCESRIPSSLSNSIGFNSSISSEACNFDSIIKHENDNLTTEISSDKIVKKAERSDTETEKCKVIKNIKSLILKDQKLNKITPKNSIEVINGITSNSTRKVQKNTEKKSMIITLQKENGEIILRKEAKVQKFKDSSPKKGLVPIEKKPILINNKSLVNANLITIKNNSLIVDLKKQLPLKLPSQPTNEKKNVLPASKIIAVDGNSSVQKKSLPGISILKKVKSVNKEAPYEGMSNCDLVEQCPVQNTEIAVNWLMKRFPLVDTKSSIASFHTRHPYCAKDRNTFLEWPFAKQRAAEWMRAKAIGRIINEIPHLEKWTTLEILDWARVRCYTPIRNIPELSLNFIYRPRIDGIMELLKQDKMLTEKDTVDVTSDSLAEEEVTNSDVEPAGTSLEVTNEGSIFLPLGQELEGFKSFLNKCMMNTVSQKPTHEELLPDVHYPAVERVLISVFSSIAEELVRRSYNASWIRHRDNPPPEISIEDVKAAIASRKEFDFLLPFSDDEGKEQPSIVSYFSK